jgi:hypothetical protein
MTNAADQRQVRKAKQKERLAHERELKDLRDVCATRQGRRFVWKQLVRAGCFHQSFVPGAADATAFNEGRRSLGLALMAHIHELDAALYIRMANEARDDERTEAVLTDEPAPVLTDQEDDDARHDTDPHT